MLLEGAAMRAQNEYVLGTDDLELARLQRQHEFLKDQTLRIWRKAGFRRGQHILELGCGPGHTTRDLARLLGPGSRITAVDISEKFLKALDGYPQPPGEAPITSMLSRVEDLELSDNSLDGAFCRYVLTYIPDIPKTLARIRRAMKPGSRFAIQEFASYETQRLCPDGASLQPIIAAIIQSWNDRGADANRARNLPCSLEENGFRVIDIEPIAVAARPDDPLWEWPDGFYRSFAPKLQEQGYITAEQTTAFFRDWESAAGKTGAFWLGPVNLSIVAEAA